MAHVEETPQPLVFATLRDEDILDYLFDTLETRSKGVGRRTLASCALVCKAWSNPASRVLWRRLDSFHPLWALLAGRNFPPSAKRLTEFWQIVEPEVFVREIFAKEPELWQHFLHRASHVREIGTASCREPELALVRAVVKHNGGATFLSTLQKLVWRNGITADTTLHLLASPSLRSLELDVTDFTQFTDLDSVQPGMDPIVARRHLGRLFSELGRAAPYLERLVISGRQLSSGVVVPNLSNFARMRELSLFREVSVTPHDVQSLFAHMPALELLKMRLKDFGDPLGTARAPSLRSLAVHGVARDIAGLLTSFLDAPFLDSLALNTLDQTHTEAHQRLLRAVSTAAFASTLRKLHLSTVLTSLGADPHLLPGADPTRAPDGTESSLAHVTEHLSALRALEVAEVHLLDVWSTLGDGDMRALAHVWPRLRVLKLAYAPSNAVPPIGALRHFAENCPELRHLVITKMMAPKIGVEGARLPDLGVREGEGGGAAGPAGHPLRSLDMRMTFAGQGGIYDVDGIAGFLDRLFPNLEVPEENDFQNTFAQMSGTWSRVAAQIRRLKAQRGA